MKPIKFFMLVFLFYLFIFFVFYIKAYAKLRLSDVYSDNMVLQRNAEIILSGYGKPDAEVTVNFIDERAITKVDNKGKWNLKLKPREAGGPCNMTIYSDEESILIKNILIGDVFFCSGQSNMEWQLMHTKDGAEELKNFQEQEKIRFFTQQQIPSPNPLKEARGVWQLCNKGNAQNFSAVAYFFGKKIYENTGVPVGLINSSWGGTPIEIWLDAKVLKGYKETEAILKRWNNLSEFNWKKWNYGKGMDYKIEFSELKFISDIGDKKTLNVKTCENCSGDLGGVWYSWAKPGSTANYKSEKDTGIIEGIIGFNAWAGAGTLLYNNESIDLSDYKFLEFNVRGNGKFSISLCQPNIEDYDFYTSQDFEASSSFKYIRIPIASFKQGGWGVAKPFTQNAIKQIQFNIKSTTIELPSVLYNGMVYPFADYKIKGVLWYQGESNVERAKQYETLLTLLIKNWRNTWKYEIPFFIVQLPNFMPKKAEPSESAWAELRESQLKVMQKLPFVITVPIIDLGDEKDIHPKIKKPVGERLANAALVLLYDKAGVTTGPLYDSMEIRENKIYIKFKNTDDGLMSKDGELKGFAISGKDKKFRWAKAEIKDNNTIGVWNDDIKEPVAVRYAWADSPDCNLYNKKGLAASPFRTDNWEGITENNY